MILISKYLVPKGYVGITCFPFIFLRDRCLKADSNLVNHEKIHLRQQLELLIVPFYFWYVVEFFIRLLIYKNWKKAYLNISFEREAYANQEDLNYLKSRPFWNFTTCM
ncbi:hypothetical protein [Psychroserpens mesophilus]|uniref:hypothetical protein n=1 Tax=Psychroserpens mesophilus TaxID=325473 RepID=UPI003D6560B5